MNGIDDICNALEVLKEFAYSELRCRKQSFLPNPTKDEQVHLDEASAAYRVAAYALMLATDLKKGPNDWELYT